MKSSTAHNKSLPKAGVTSSMTVLCLIKL